jgi:hypothetical protein
VVIIGYSHGWCFHSNISSNSLVRQSGNIRYPLSWSSTRNLNTQKTMIAVGNLLDSKCIHFADSCPRDVPAVVLLFWPPSKEGNGDGDAGVSVLPLSSQELATATQKEQSPRSSSLLAVVYRSGTAGLDWYGDSNSSASLRLVTTNTIRL